MLSPGLTLFSTAVSALSAVWLDLWISAQLSVSLLFCIHFPTADSKSILTRRTCSSNPILVPESRTGNSVVRYWFLSAVIAARVALNLIWPSELYCGRTGASEEIAMLARWRKHDASALALTLVVSSTWSSFQWAVISERPLQFRVLKHTIGSMGRVRPSPVMQHFSVELITPNG